MQARQPEQERAGAATAVCTSYTACTEGHPRSQSLSGQLAAAIHPLPAHHHLLKHVQRTVRLVAPLHARNQRVVANGVWLQALQGGTTVKQATSQGTGLPEVQEPGVAGRACAPCRQPALLHSNPAPTLPPTSQPHYTPNSSPPAPSSNPTPPAHAASRPAARSS